MAINPASPFVLTSTMARFRAAYPVDIQAANPNAITETSAKADVVVIAGTLNGSGNIVPLTGGGGGGGSSLADSLVVDAAGVYWILQDQGAGTFVYYNLSTLAVGTPTAPVSPAASSQAEQIVEQSYTVITAGSGYAVGDILRHVVVLNVLVTPVVVNVSAWINITQGTVLAGAPAPANITITPNNQAITVSDGADVSLGAKADAAYAGTGSASLISAVKGCYTLLAAPLPAGTNAIGTVGVTGTVAVTQSGTWSTGRTWALTSGTDSVTIGAPLPAGANAIGSITNTGFAATQSGTWTVQPGNTANTTAWLVTGAGGTFPITAASLPLPTGAAVSVAQASTTSGQAGSLVMGAVTTATPTYTTGTTNNLSLTTAGALRSDIYSLGGSGIASSSGNGSSLYGLGGFQITAVLNTDQSATAFAGAGSVLGTVVASAHGSGAVISAEINVSALTLGTATAVFAILQESRGGTNFSDIWVSPPITATGIISTPPLVVAGRRRWRFFSTGGTSTTVTVTITSLELPTGGYPLVREGYDGYSATNPLATMFNNATTASTLVSTTVSSASNPIYIEGAKNLMASLTVTGGVPTTNPVLTLQISIDGTNWFNTALTLTPTAAGTFGASLANITGRFARFIVSTASAGGTAYTFGKLGLLATN